MGIHDQLFKDLLVTFFSQLLSLALPSLARRHDTEQASFHRQEIFVDLPQGDRREVDVVAEIPAFGPDLPPALVHVEVERRARPEISQRLWRYWMQLKLRHDLPLVTLVIFLEGGEPNVVEKSLRETVCGQKVAHFRYLAFGLEKSCAEDYLRRPEPLAWALAALMRPRTMRPSEHKMACLEAIARADLDRAQQFLLCNCVETYVQLTDEETERYDVLLAQTADREVKDMQQTWADRMREEGRQQGMQQGMRQLILRLLEARFGPLSEAVRQRLEGKSPQELEELQDQVLQAGSLGDLELA